MSEQLNHSSILLESSLDVASERKDIILEFDKQVKSETKQGIDNNKGVIREHVTKSTS